MSTESPVSPSGLRVVAYCVLPMAYQLIREWAERGGHRLLLVVTTPGPPARRSGGYREIVAMAPPRQEILLTTRMQRPVPLIAALAPDIVLSFTFPYRIPPEVTAIPALGAINLHPAPLPKYRGPNPPRMVYDGHPTLGATLHRTAADFDTGAVLSLHECPLPDDPTGANVFAAWSATMRAALEEGMRRAVAGEPGVLQEEAGATYAAPFTEEEKLLGWNLPAKVLQCRTVALNMLGAEAHAVIGGQPYAVQRLTRLHGMAPPDAPGVVLGSSTIAQANGTVCTVFTICAADGVVQAVATQA